MTLFVYIFYLSCKSIFSETLLFLHQIFFKGLCARLENWPTLVLGKLVLLTGIEIDHKVIFCLRNTIKTYHDIPSLLYQSLTSLSLFVHHGYFSPIWVFYHLLLYQVLSQLLRLWAEFVAFKLFKVFFWRFCQFLEN